MFTLPTALRTSLGLASRALLLTSLLGLTGCSVVKQRKLKETEVFYRASTMDSYVPKSAETPIPVLNVMPPRSKVIGRFTFTTPKDSQFAVDAAIYNARKAGADAIVIRKMDERTTPYSYYVKPETVSVPKTRSVTQPVWIRESGGIPGHWEPRQRLETYYIVEHRPGHVVSGTNHHTTIDAEMIRQK